MTSLRANKDRFTTLTRLPSHALVYSPASKGLFSAAGNIALNKRASGLSYLMYRAPSNDYFHCRLICQFLRLFVYSMKCQKKC